ncbi:M15 family metallopeptidase [Antribacter gilvus]|uniref:M15 family metallopeptidase n=1 Tax=Antribacter gilvus TaxID=2304675 RepID=UPI0013DF8C19|nr:M15 family metallopeptidase [Antribacter gilvus]
MTSTSTLPETGPPSGTTAKDRREAKLRRRRTLRVAALVSVLLMVLGGGGGATWYVLSEREALAETTVEVEALLQESDGKVADPATRDALSREVGEADRVLAERFPVGLVLGGTAERRESLLTTSATVRASMVDLARAEVETVRAGLAAVVPDAEAVLAATDGMGADEARAGLRTALDAAVATEAEATQALAGTDVAALEQVEADLAAQRDGVVVASESLYDAQDAITCPAPDQEWSPRSGHLDPAELAEIPWAPGYALRADLLPTLVALDTAYQQAFGVHLTINSAYRTYDDQLGVYEPSSPIAAPPGCSTHGLGVAADFGGGVQTFGTPQYQWLKANSAAHGWEHPSWAEPGGRVPEPWHWQSVQAPAASR